ncbi:hypothetical protein ACFLIM_08825 [Nonomuraea sp. M3C6]|uniref:Secreted protein n=1 Tax=Nonomuraea marmarensis TaxID=3351344 RepID=A0ABW7AAU0_9ACTN
MGSRTAISAGVLAVALAAVPVAAPAASAASQDCTRDGGLLSGVTNTLCDVVNAVSGTVGSITGGTTDQVTKGVENTTGEVLGRVGEAVPTTKATPSKSSGPSPAPAKTGLVPKTLEEVCLPVLACDEQGVLDRLSPTPSADPAQRPREGRAEASALPTQTPVRPESRPQLMDTERPVAEKDTADADEPRVDLLWPNPFAHELTVPMQDQRVVRPSPPASDVLGTALTIALLGSAVLATRIVQQRRHRAEPTESIPFEPARAGNGRHRLA